MFARTKSKQKNKSPIWNAERGDSKQNFFRSAYRNGSLCNRSIFPSALCSRDTCVFLGLYCNPYICIACCIWMGGKHKGGNEIYKWVLSFLAWRKTVCWFAFESIHWYSYDNDWLVSITVCWFSINRTTLVSISKMRCSRAKVHQTIKQRILECHPKGNLIITATCLR